MKCIHYKVADRELCRLKRELLKETDPDQRASIRDLIYAQARIMEQHWKCGCEGVAA